MRFLIIFNLLFSINTFAQDKDIQFILENDLTPAGTKYIGDGLFFDETEMTNIGYLEFLYCIKTDSGFNYYLSVLPDTSLDWSITKNDIIIDSDRIDSADSYSRINRHYLRNPLYKYYPVIGISYEQARQYCSWRSASVTQVMNQSLKKRDKNYTVRYTYYLPSKEDWLAATDPDINSAFLKQLKSKHIKRLIKDHKTSSYYRASIKQPYTDKHSGRNILICGVNFIGYQYDNGPNSKHIYNTYGNVSELTDEPGVSFGGSWQDSYEKIIPRKFFDYDKPNCTLGFRCACKVEIFINDDTL